MKKILPLFFVAILCAVSANAQVKLGVKGGLNVSSMSFSDDVFDGSNRTGWFVGPTVKFTVPIVGLSFDLSALYNQTSSKVSADNMADEMTIKRQSIEVPINIRYGVGLGSLANIFLFAGPQFGFNVGDDEFEWTSTSSYKSTFQLKKSALSVNVGAGVTLSHLQLTANYNIACGKTGEATVVNVLSEAATNTYKGRSNSWQIGLAYFF